MRSPHGGRESATEALRALLAAVASIWGFARIEETAAAAF
jgi:hypothetical protein